MIMSILFQVGFAVIVFFLTYLIFKRLMKGKNPIKLFSFWLSWIIITHLSYIVVVVLFISISFRSVSKEFDSQAWKENEQGRVQMVDDLINKKLLYKKSKSEVISLLGEPLVDSHYFENSGRDMIYYLGNERSFTGVDSEWLLIWFDDDSVSKYEVYRD